MYLLAANVSACPFCAPSSSDIYTITSNSLAVAKAKKVGPQKYKILESLKGSVKIGKVVLAGAGPNKDAPEGTLVLLSTISNPAQPFWSEPARILSPIEFFFFQKALAIRKRPRLLDLAAQHLGHKSKYIAESAYNILAPEPEKEVQKRAHFLGRSRLIELIQKPTVPDKEKSLYLFMLLPELGTEDKAWIRPTLFNLSPHSDHFPAYMVVYAQAAGGEGVKEMGARFLKASVTSSESFGPTSGFAYLGGRGGTRKDIREAARGVFRKELQHPDRGVFAIGTLGEWQDFSVAKQVEALAEKHFDTPWVVSSVARYFRNFDNPEAKRALGRLEKRFPKIVKSSNG